MVGMPVGMCVKFRGRAAAVRIRSGLRLALGRPAAGLAARTCAVGALGGVDTAQCPLRPTSGPVGPRALVPGWQKGREIMEKQKVIDRNRQDSNLRGETPIDF